ncbi:hypothetical protein GCM10011391_00340 [Pullulanibacillus camelliae]|uniref:L,D-TPase catalytic domain-containing protein n=1 Tax=Pullulanibacillus camelliae TaxID=1707096 RepID=A0A8J2VI66_9BACL|nr:L,D-transpeptidase family protein [Pullulanibacillus camelliae]GGE25903.1 hypothetical protein GCM10011391_00340 [Pullulanibacillus camelliae]
MHRWGVIVPSSLIFLMALLLGCLYYHQATHFNRHIKINHIDVGGLTAEQAIDKLKGAVSKHVIYVGQTRLMDGKDTSMGFTEKDRNNIKTLLRQQRTIFPSAKEKNYVLRPEAMGGRQVDAIKTRLKEKLLKINKDLAAPQNASVRLKNGKIIVLKGKKGTRYDVSSLLKAYQKQAFNSEIHLASIHQQQTKADSAVLQQEKKKLQDLVQQTVNYKLQNKTYAFRGSEVIKNVTLTKDMKYNIDQSMIEEKLDKLNQSLSTLHKNYTFKTHSGQVISVKGQSYGWAIDCAAEAKRIKEAFIKGEDTIPAYNIYGEGWNVNGVGYHNPTNHGIGDTYVEVSIKAQRIWVYRQGQLAVTTPVVTGTHAYNEDTPKGVWYIEYKASPSVLKGSEVGNPNYSIKVQYWAPFTQSGSGFHDASWRTNWSSHAYINNGSGGCVNTPPSIMKKVYDNLTQYEPVVVY